MSKHKFKVGDKVRIRDGSNICRYAGGWAASMSQFVGEIHEIVGIIENDFACRLKHLDFIWDLRGLELVKPEKIIIYRNGAEVVAKDTATGKIGIAKCSPEDTFDFNTGAKLAFDRLINPEPEKPKYYNGKIVCTDPGIGGGYTVGKIYEVKNGKLLDDDRRSRPCDYRMKSVQHYNNCAASKFIEIVE